jgi:nucleoside-diphosphate-sugar epimerase
MAVMAGRGPIVVVTGGAGFLGREIVGTLLEPRVETGLHPREVRVLDRDVEGLGEREGVVAVTADVRDLRATRRAFEGADVVIHCAALVDWGQHPASLVESVNLGGTHTVIRACREAGVRALVHTSSEDAVYGGGPIVDGDETLPYPERPVNAYCATKAQGERAVLGACRDGMLACVIRPCSIWGGGDRFHIGSLIEMAKRGPLMRIGDGSSRCQPVYVGNVAHAHVLAAAALLEGREDVAGEVFFVTDHPKANFFDFFEPFVNAAGYRMQPWSRALPARPMYALGALVEIAARVLAPVHGFTPIVSRFGVAYVSHDVTFSGEKARRVLGYEPVYPPGEARRITAQWFEKHGEAPP